MSPSWGVLLLSLWCGSTVSFSYAGESRFEDSLCQREWSAKNADSSFNPFASHQERYSNADLRPKTINIPVICLHDNLREANQSWDLSHLIEFERNGTFGKYAFPTLHGKGKGAASATGDVPLRTSNGTEVYDQVCLGVSVESNMTIVMLVVSSSCLLHENNTRPTSSGTFTIKQSSRMDNKTSEESNIRVSKERVLTANILWLTNTTAAPEAFIVCEMKLCHKLWSKTCPAGCSQLFRIYSPLTVYLETNRSTASTDTTFNTALLIGIVLGIVLPWGSCSCW